MKKLAIAVAVVATLIGCSKESEMALNEASNDRVALSTSGSFDIGSVGGGGQGAITYNLQDLEELCACAVSEDFVSGLQIDHIQGVGYYLSGIGSSTGSYTTFSVELTNDNGVLSWEDNATIFTCETTASSPCDLDIMSQIEFDCSNTAGACGGNVIGGEGGASYADCNWPWIVPQKTKK